MTNADHDADELDAAESLLAKLRLFIRRELDPVERSLLAALLAPGVAAAYGSDDDVVGLAAAHEGAVPLPEHLARVIRVQGLAIDRDWVGFD